MFFIMLIYLFFGCYVLNELNISKSNQILNVNLLSCSALK